MKIKCLGEKNVAGKKIEGVSGGFGKDQRSILARDIAKVHDTNVKVINQLINRNRKRFVDDVDVIDLKKPDFEATLHELNFSPREIGNANNIYLLSERGYAKLLKIMDNDSAWEIYEKLVDEYFILRSRRPMTEYQRLKIQDKQEKLALKRAEILFKQAEKAPSLDMRMQLLQQAEAVLTGQAPLAIAQRSDHYASAAAVAKRLNVLGKDEKPSGKAVMEIAKKMKIIAPMGSENQYGRWDMGNWTFTEKGVGMVERYIVEGNM